MSGWYDGDGPELDTVVHTCVRLSRNLRELPFPVKMTDEDRRSLEEKVMRAASQTSAAEYRFRWIDLEQISKEEAVSLVERYLTVPEFIAERSGRGILTTADESVSVALNGEDHLLIQSAVRGLDPEKAYRTADRLDTILDKSLHFAFDGKLGFLTQNPVNLGTGMRASLTLHLPALKHEGEITRLSSGLAGFGLVLHGIYGSAAEPKGALYQLSNQVTLGLSEWEALSNLKGLAAQILSRERAAREELAKSLEIQDTVSRSLAILKSARMLTNEELMELISRVRFGVAAGLLRGPSFEVLDRLLVRSQPATLTGGRQIPPEKRHALRARLAAEALRDGPGNSGEDGFS